MGDLNKFCYLCRLIIIFKFFLVSILILKGTEQWNIH